VSADPFPPYRFLEDGAEEGSKPFIGESLVAIAREIHRRRSGRGLFIVDDQLGWDNPQGRRGLVKITFKGRRGEAQGSLRVSTAGENALELGEALEATRFKRAPA